jgi:hypothetical protein
MENFKGTCGCGNIEYRFKGKPVTSAFCYCTECQKHTGSDKWFGLWVKSEQFDFTKGNPSKFTRLGDYGNEVIHRFCNDCGTTLCIEVPVANIFSVAASTLNSPHTFSPDMAIYTASAPLWAVFPENIPKYDTMPPGM